MKIRCSRSGKVPEHEWYCLVAFQLVVKRLESIIYAKHGEEKYSELVTGRLCQHDTVNCLDDPERELMRRAHDKTPATDVSVPVVTPQSILVVRYIRYTDALWPITNCGTPITISPAPGC